MKTTQDKLNKLLETKSNIYKEIKEKGVEFSEDVPFGEYPAMIQKIRCKDIVIYKSIEEMQNEQEVEQGEFAMVYDNEKDIFVGLFEYDGSKWEYAKTQLTATAENIAHEYIGYGPNGVQVGNFTTDATATSSDIIAPLTAYAKGVKLTGTIQVEKEGIDYEFLNRKLNTTEAINDYRTDIGIAVKVSGKQLQFYSIDKNNNLLNNIYNYTMAISGNVTDVVFAKKPIIDTEDHLVYNVYIAEGYIAEYSFYQGVAVMRYDVKTNQMYSDAEYSLKLEKIHKIYGWAYTNMSLTPISMSVLPIDSNHVVLTQTRQASTYQNRVTTPYQGVAWLVTDNKTSLNSINISHKNNAQRHVISHTGTILMSMCSDKNFSIYRFYNNFVNYSVILTASASVYFPIILDDKFLYNNKLYDETGGIIREYSELPFRSNTSYKFYITGYIVELDLNNTTVYLYTYDRRTYDIKAEAVYTDAISNYIAFNENNTLKQFPTVQENAIALWNGTSGNFSCLEMIPGGYKIKKIIKDSVIFFNMSECTITSAGQLLRGISAYGSTGKIDGTMPNNGELIYEPSNQQQTIPAGYTSGGKINAVNIVLLDDYKTCDAIADEILGGNIE